MRDACLSVGGSKWAFCGVHGMFYRGIARQRLEAVSTAEMRRNPSGLAVRDWGVRYRFWLSGLAGINNNPRFPPSTWDPPERQIESSAVLPPQNFATNLTSSRFSLFFPFPSIPFILTTPPIDSARQQPSCLPLLWLSVRQCAGDPIADPCDTEGRRVESVGLRVP